MKRIIAIGIILTSALFAQPRGQNAVRRQSPAIDVSRQQTIEGTVTALNLAYGAQYPSVLVSGKLIKLAPVWFLLDSGLELRIGDPVKLETAASTDPTDSTLYALRLTNERTKAELQLRDDTGYPLWSRRGDGAGQQGTKVPGCTDSAAPITVSGTVQSASYGTGIEMPILVLRNTDGTLLSFKIGPEWSLLEADVELKAGMPLTVVAVRDCQNEYLALSLTFADGTVLKLRDADRTPVWRSHVRP